MELANIKDNWFLIICDISEDHTGITSLAGCTDLETATAFHSKKITWKEILGTEHEFCSITFPKDAKLQHLMKITKLTEEDVAPYKDIIFENHELEI